MWLGGYNYVRFLEGTKYPPLSFIGPMTTFHQEDIDTVKISQIRARTSFPILDASQMSKLIFRPFLLVEVCMSSIELQEESCMACRVVGPHQQTIRHFG